MSSSVVVCAPFAGRVVALADVPDPVFSERMVGPGLAIDPRGHGPVIDAVSPVTGTIGALHPHAYALQAPGAQVLVHLGLNTSTLRGTPFEVLVTPDQQVNRGDLVTRWNLEDIGSLSPLTPVIALGAQTLDYLANPGDEIIPGAPLYEIPTD